MSKRTLKIVGHGYIFDRRIENSIVISSFDKSSHQDLGEIFFFFLFNLQKKDIVVRVETSRSR